MKYHHSENKDKEIMCELCGKSIKFKLLAHHMKTHDKNKMCTICDKFFIAGSKKLIEHLGQDHGVYCHNNDYYICQTCHLKCHSSRELQDHLIKVHQLETNQHCEHCVTSYPTKSLLAIHLMDCHNYKASKAAQSLGTVTKVLTDHSTNKHQCDICDKKLASKRTLFDHKKQVHNRANHLKCDHCDYTSHEPSRLKRHILEKHTKPTKFPCDQCPYVTNINSILLTHKRKQHEGLNKRNVCTECDKKLASKRTLFDHKKQVHNRANHLKCDHCDYTSHEPSRLKRHILEKHTKATKFPCDQCPYVTNINSILLTHKRNQHEGYKKRNACTECDKKFTTKKKLAEHMLAEHNIAYEYTTPFGH